jgi:RNA polymerase sigma factor (TIGR02999 family)
MILRLFPPRRSARNALNRRLKCLGPGVFSMKAQVPNGFRAPLAFAPLRRRNASRAWRSGARLFGHDGMSEVTQILERAMRGQPNAAEELLPLVYDELRKLAAHKMALEPPGHTLQPTALVHEAWLRLTAGVQSSWEGRGHFFAAAAEAMRRILVENARRKKRVRHGGGEQRVELEEVEIASEDGEDKLLQVDEALDELAEIDPVQAKVVKLRFFVGLKNDEVGEVLGISEKTVRRYWTHAKAWLYERIRA